MIKRYLYPGMAAVLILILLFCGGRTSDPAHLDESGPEQPEETGAAAPDSTDHEEEHEDLQVSLEKQGAWGIVFGQPGKQAVTAVVALPGTLSLNMNKTAYISTFSQGKVTHISSDLGSRVNRGQVLAVINSPEFGKAKAEFLEARTRLNLSRKEFERAQRLLAEKALEEKEYLRREAEYEKITAEYGALGSNLHSYGYTHEQIDALIARCESMGDDDYRCELADPLLSLYSPVTGTVIHRNAVLGQHVQPEEILFTVSDLSVLWAEFEAFEKDLPLLRPGMAVAVSPSAFPEMTFPGTVTYISDTVDVDSRTVMVRAEVENRDNRLKPNMYIQGRIENSSEKELFLAVPEEAVQNLDGEKIVFVRESEEVLAVRHVTLGRLVDLNRIILDGLDEGDEVVIKGAFKLKAEMTKSDVGQAHIH